jgi:hypothetical protein
MVAPPDLIWHRRTNNALFRISGGTTGAQIGPNLTDSETAGFWKNDDAIKYRGRLIVLQGDVAGGEGTSLLVQRHDPATDTFTLVHTGTNGNAGAGASADHSGLFVALVGGVETLAFVALHSAAGTGNLYTSADGVTWSTTPVTWTGTGATRASFMHRNVIYCAHPGGYITGTDVTTGVVTTYDVSASINIGTLGGVSFCTFRNRFFMLAYPTGTGAMTLWELFAGAWVSRGTLAGASTSASATTKANARHALFPVGITKMVAIYIDSDGTDHGTQACDCTPASGTSFNFTDVTTTVVPVSLRPAAVAANQSHGWVPWIDNANNVAPTSPARHLWHASSATGIFTYFEYTDSATEIAGGSISVSANLVPSAVTYGGGDRVSADSTGALVDLDARVVGLTPIPGGIRVSYRAYGDPGSANKYLRLWHAANEGDVMTQATLMGTATGGTSTRSGNQIEQVDADNGTTLYTFDWNATADGYVNGAQAHRLLRIGTA